MELMNQPFTGQLGDRLIELLDSSEYDTLNIAVAFAKNSGVLRIKDALDRFRERGGKVNAYLGIDLGGTSYEALTVLLLNTDSLNVVHSEKSQTFHSKIYQFLGKKSGFVIVGSHNLTGGGLWTNFESSVHICLNQSCAIDAGVSKELSDYFGALSSLNDGIMPIKSQAEIERLLQNGYVLKEVTQEVRLAKETGADGAQESLFGKGVPANLPRLKMSEHDQVEAGAGALPKTVSAPQNDESQTIWFETRKMTGGSRNILDLSKKSLLERGDPTGTPFDRGEKKFMRGGVEFFGVNPDAVDQTKNISLNFEGVDYSGNTILYPDGENKNGTWRLQIKGVSSINEKITDVLRAKYNEGYLVEKVIAFTKIQDDYYSLSVFPEAEIDSFKEASIILARNGASRGARMIGLI